jgi:hypothetical protein
MSKLFLFLRNNDVRYYNLYYKLHNHFPKEKAELVTDFGSGSATGTAYFLLEAEAPEAEVEAPRVEAESLKILALPHHWTFRCGPPAGHRRVGHGGPRSTLGSPWPPLAIRPCFSSPGPSTVFGRGMARRISSP